MFKKEPYSEDRGDISIQWIFILLVSLTVIGGIAGAVTGLPSDIIPSPRGEVAIEQTGDEVTITIRSLQSEVDAITVNHVGDGSLNNKQGNQGSTTGYPNAEANFSETTAGSIMKFDGVQEGDVITVTGHKGGSKNQLAKREIGPT